MAGRGGRRGRGGARGGRGGTSPNLNLQMRSPEDADEPSAKKAKEEAADDELSDLLIQPAEILIKICNYLDPSAFRELAFTCKGFYHFCRNAKGINIVVFMEEVEFGTHPIKFYYSCPCGRLHEKGFLKYLKKLHEWKFTIQIDRFNLLGADWKLLQKYVKRFARNGVKKIRILYNALTPRTLEEAKIIADFSELFGIEILSFYNYTYMLADIMKACLQLPVTKLDFLETDGEIEVDIISNCNISRLSTSFSITLDVMKEILEIWKTRKGLEYWTFTPRVVDVDEFCNSFNRRYEVLPFDHGGPIRSRSSVFYKAEGQYEEKHTFYIRRQDGEVFSVSHFPWYGDYFVDFCMCPIDKYPLALRDI